MDGVQNGPGEIAVLEVLSSQHYVFALEIINTGIPFSRGDYRNGEFQHHLDVNKKGHNACSWPITANSCLLWDKVQYWERRHTAGLH